MNNKEITITPDRFDSSKITQIAKLYAQVFAAPPWNEAVKCDSCNKFQGLDVSLESICNCGGVFKEAYPLM